MTEQFNRAVRLYKQYKDCTREYKQLAEELGFRGDTGLLNQAVWRHLHPGWDNKEDLDFIPKGRAG